MARKKTRKLRVAFIGAGGIAGTHMRYLKEMDDVELVAAADIAAQSVQRRCQEFGIGEAFTDYRRMLSKVKPEAVSVCTPNGLHAPCTMAALKAGAHVIVEKPLAMNAREGRKMLEAAKKSRRKLVIGFQYRFDPKTQFIKKAMDAGQLGRMVYARVLALRRRGIPNWGVFGRRELQGGGPLIDIGVHALEMAHYAMGSPRPVSASGRVFTYLGDKKSSVLSQWPNWDYKTYTVEDLAVGQIQLENGAIIHVEASFAAHLDKDVFGFQVMGEKGGATWDPPVIFRDDIGHMVNAVPGWLPSAGFGDCFRMKMRNFVEHVLYGAPTLAPAEHGLMVQKMLDGIYQSAARGRQVRIS
jgi:predicted dehydrogenase